jgi:hypothetical protein
MEKQGKRNLLLELAASYGWKPPVNKFANAKLSWKDELVDWTQQIPLEYLQDFIISFVSWRTSWPDVHLTYLGLKENSSYKNRLDYALSTVQVAAYTSSEKLLKPLFLTEPPNLRSVISVIHHLGFTYWGQRRYQMALSTFLGLLKTYDLALREWQAQPDADIKKLVSSSARHYLEILIEVIHNLRGNTERRDFVRNTRADYVLALFRQLKLERTYLNQIAILETQYWLGMPVSLVAARELFDQCMAMQEWEAAALVAQFLLILDRMDGQKAAHEILPQLQKRGSWKLMTKVYASLIYERLNRRIPVQVLNFKAFTNILLVAVELIFALKRFIWDLDQRLG